MKNIIVFALLVCSLGFGQKENYVDMSSQLVTAIKNNSEAADGYVKKIAEANQDELLNQLNSDDAKKTFFINLYNSFVIYSLRKDRSLFDNRGAFFSTKRFIVAGNKVSLDNIEHDYLRHSSKKWGLGIIHTIFPGKTERKFRVDEVDWRIHFSLNCGAKSCPPVRAYHLENIEKEIDDSARKYFAKNHKYDKKEEVLFVPVLMNWFRADFGNKRGVRIIAREFGIIPTDAKPCIKYLDYDWTLDINNFI
jgi:hypothetical protein